MNRNRVMRGLGLITLVMLAFGLAGCGSEPAPVARPPAPPPAPPPFQPQAVEVALGESGDTVTLMTAEGGGFTLNGEAFAGGVETAENGNMYLLAFADDKWTATFQEPAGIEVMLGDHGGTVIITMTEDGKYFIGEMEITADTMVMGENGHYYTPGLDEEGMWVAMWVMPEAVSVMLGDHGGTVMLQLAEDNSWWIGEMAFASGDMQMGDNGQYYALTYDMDSGMWMAMYTMPDPVSVMLGDHGGSRMLQLAEDNTWWYDGMLFADGEMLMGDNGQYYTLSMDDEGMWMAMHVMPDPVMVALGTSGSVELQQAEDQSWWIGTMAFASGDSYDAANGNEYMLTYDMETGAWSSSFVPMEMEIMGTGLVVMSREGDDMYDVAGSEDTIPASGMGDVTIDGAMYHVWMDEDEMLMGARFDMAIADSTAIGPIEEDGDILNPLGLALSADDEDTAANEAMTHLVLDEQEFSIGDLLESGSLSTTGKTFVEEAREEVAKLLGQVEKLVDINAGLDRDDRNDFTRNYDSFWEKAEEAVEMIFGDDQVTLDPLQKRAGKAVEDEVVEDFQTLLEALSTASAFEEALDEEGIFEQAQELLEEAGKDAAEVFEASMSQSTVFFGSTETTRYGVFAKQSRENAIDDVEYVHGDEQGAIGAFSYGLVADTVRTSHLPDSGTASFTGGTTAVTGHKEPRLYEGRFDMEVSFPTSRVTAQVSELEDSEGDPWQHQLRDVETIYLPNATLDRNAHFDTDRPASVIYSGFAARPVSVPDTTFEGWLLGAGRGEETATGAFGTWSLGDPEDATGNYLAASFGVERTDVRETDAPDVEGEGVETLLTDKTDAIKKGRTVFRPLGTAKDPDDSEAKRYIEISLSTLEEDEDGSYTRNGATKIDGLKSDIERLLRQLDGVILTDESDGDVDAEFITDRENIWNSIRAKVRAVLFGLGLETYPKDDDGTPIDGNANDAAPAMIPVDVEEGGRGRPAYDAELGMRPAGSEVPENGYTVPDADDDGNPEPVTLEERALLYVLSGPTYPTSGSKPNDAQARSEIQDVLDALASGSALEDALDDGIFEGFRAETGRTAYEDDNFDSYADVDTTEDMEDRERDVDSRKTGGDIAGERTNKVHVRFGTTDFTRFGVSWGEGNAKATANHFAYSPLPQTRYLNTSSPGYPAVGGSEARATYTGSTIFKSGTTSYQGDVEIDVTWNPVSIASSKVTTSLSALETIADGDPFTIKYVLVDADGARFLKNGTDDIMDYSDGYDPLSMEVSGDGADAETVEGYDITRDPRNAFASAVEFDVAEIIIHRNILVTTSGDDNDLIGFMGMDSMVDIVWEDKAFGRTELDHSAASIEGQFLGQGLDGPLAVMGIWSFTAPTGVLQAQAVTMLNDDNETVIVGGDRGRATFKPLENLNLDFNPNARWEPGSAQDVNGLVNKDAVGGPALANTLTVTGESVVTNADGTMTIQSVETTTTLQVDTTGYLMTTTRKQVSPAPTDGQADPVTSYGPMIWGAFGTGP